MATARLTKRTVDAASSMATRYTGIPWNIDETAPKAKHLAKPEDRFTRIGPHAAAAIRLLLLTGARLREILHVRWEKVDFERAMLFLPDSKTGRKPILLNAPIASSHQSPLRGVSAQVRPLSRSQNPKKQTLKSWHHSNRRSRIPVLGQYAGQSLNEQFGPAGLLKKARTGKDIY